MSDIAQIKIKVDATGHGELFVDDKKMDNIHAVKIEIEAGELTKIWVQIVGELELETAAEVQTMDSSYIHYNKVEEEKVNGS